MNIPADRPVHLLCQIDDPSKIDARIDDLDRAIAMSRLPTEPIDVRRAKHRKLFPKWDVEPDEVVLRVDPADDSVVLAMARWKPRDVRFDKHVELSLVDVSRHTSLLLSESHRIMGPRPDLGPGDEAWLTHLRSLLQSHRDLLAMPREQRPPSPHTHVSELLEVAARAAHRAGLANQKVDRPNVLYGAGKVRLDSIRISKPSLYGHGDITAYSKNPDRFAIRLANQHAIRSDLARLPLIVEAWAYTIGTFDHLDFNKPKDTFHSMIRDDRDPMERLRSASINAIDVEPLALARHITTLDPNVDGNLALNVDADVGLDDVEEACRAMIHVAGHLDDASIDPVGRGAVVIDLIGSAALAHRHASIHEDDCVIEWTFKGTPGQTRPITIRIDVLGRHATNTPVPDRNAIEAELRHLAKGLSDGVRSSDVTLALNHASDRSNAFIDSIVEKDDGHSPWGMSTEIDAFGNLKCEIVPNGTNTYIPVFEDPSHAAQWIGNRTACGRLDQIDGPDINLIVRNSITVQRYHYADPSRTDPVSRLRTEIERSKGILPTPHERLVDHMRRV